MKTYPATISRTLDPAKKSLITVVGMHDHKITDADINLMQDLQDYKRSAVLSNTTCSGVLSYSPLSFTPFTPLTFTMPSMDVMFNGEVVTITGNNSVDVTKNIITVPAPTFWASGSTDVEAHIYVVFLELWYANLNPLDGSGYATDPLTLLRYYYPYGCVNAHVANWIADDVVDPFEDNLTTQRAQIQWAIRVQEVPLSYDFSQYKAGLDAGSDPAETVYGQGSQDEPLVSAVYKFQHLDTVTGDAGLWRSGNGNLNNSLATMDGYSYAMPIAVVFQRNTGVYSIENNPLGCADYRYSSSGLIASALSGRYDNKYADAIYAEDVVDTRTTISLHGFNFDRILKEGFADLVTGQIRCKIARGESPGNKPIALGSVLDYNVAVSSTPIPNTDVVGAFDGFMNGFSSDERTYYSTVRMTTANKSVGSTGNWVLGDAVTISLPATSNATIDYAMVQVAVNSELGGMLPLTLMNGQVAISGIGTKSVTIKFIRDLAGTPSDPKGNDLYISLGVHYAAGLSADLKKVPLRINGGFLVDASAGEKFPVMGVAEYDVFTTMQTTSTSSLKAYNPNYSSTIFGTRIITTVNTTQAQRETKDGMTLTSFLLDRTTLGDSKGLYAVRAWDITGTTLTIVRRTLNGGLLGFSIMGNLPSNTVINVEILCDDTVQLSYTPAVKGVTAIEETVLAGNYTSDASLIMNNRVSLVSTYSANGVSTIVLGAVKCSIKGIAGDDVVRFLFVKDLSGVFVATPIISAEFSSGMVSFSVPSTINLNQQKFFVVMSVLPVLSVDSQLTITESYIPYQGEGVEGHDYSVIHAEDSALVTTNGTGAAPIVGLKDVYPYDRRLPLVTTLPSLINWKDSNLSNQAVSTLFDSNVEAKRFGNVAHTFQTPIHTNDFIEPVAGDKRTKIRFGERAGSRGFSKVYPHVGYAIAKPKPKSVLSESLMATVGSVTIYINGISGSDSYDGLTRMNAKRTVTGALGALPPVLRHPVTIILIDTGTPYSISQMKNYLQTIALGDGELRSIKYYALGNIAFTMQESGRLVISREASSSTPVTIDATGFAGMGTGPTSAFFVDNSRVIFNGLRFTGFTDPAIKGIDSDIELVDCEFASNLTAGSFEQGSLVSMVGGSLALSSGANGFILSGSQMVASGVQLKAVASSGVFYVVERSSSVTLSKHSIGRNSEGVMQEDGVSNTSVIAMAKINSNVVCTSDFVSGGKAILQMSSVLSRTVTINPFVGGVDADESSVNQSNL